LQDTQQRLSELQQRKGQGPALHPVAEQKAELENFRKKQAEVSKELKQAQKDLRKEVVSLETRLKWLNILAMPLAVTLAGDRHRPAQQSNAKRLRQNEPETIHHPVGARRGGRRGGTARSPAQQ
jgi:hypothetical protein